MKIFPTGKDKKPLISGWQQAATDNIEAITNWYEFYGEESIEWGVPTGAANNVTVLDVDVPDGTETLQSLGLLDWATGQAAYLTPSGGLHIYCRYIPGLRNSAGKMGPGLDIRGEGGYVVAYDPEAAEKVLTGELPELPAILKAKLTDQAPKTGPAVTGTVIEGGRNHYLTQMAGKLQRMNLLTEEALQALNERDCVPPLPEAEVRAIVGSVGRYTPEEPAMDEVSKIVWAKNMVNAMLEYLNDKSLVKGEPTGLAPLDNLLGGGKRLGELTVTLAEAKTGKNTLWHQLMVGWLYRGIKVGYASRELSPEEEVLPNLLSVKTLRNMLKADSLTTEELAGPMEHWHLAFASGYGAMPGDSLFVWMDQCREEGIKYFFIDHLHYLLEDPEEFKFISKLIRKIKAYAKSHKVHVDLIVQPKILEPGARLGLNSLRGGASIGQALDNLFTLQRVRDENGRKTNVVHVCLEAARHKLANLGDFYLQYDPTTMTFMEVVPAPPESEERDAGPVADRGAYFQGTKRL